MTLRSAFVTTYGLPMERHPCDTTERTRTPGPSQAPTAPDVVTRSSSTSRLPPGPRAADAMPPYPGTPTSAPNVSASNVNGSARSSSATGSNGGGAPSTYGATGPPTDPAHSDTPGRSSTSTPGPTTATAAHPSSTPGDRTASTAPAASSSAPPCASVTNRSARSGREPPNRSS